jgi:hypothetical protein
VPDNIAHSPSTASDSRLPHTSVLPDEPVTQKRTALFDIRALIPTTR